MWASGSFWGSGLSITLALVNTPSVFFSFIGSNSHSAYLLSTYYISGLGLSVAQVPIMPIVLGPAQILCPANIWLPTQNSPPNWFILKLNPSSNHLELYGKLHSVATSGESLPLLFISCYLLLPTSNFECIVGRKGGKELLSVLGSRRPLTKCPGWILARVCWLCFLPFYSEYLSLLDIMCKLICLLSSPRIKTLRGQRLCSLQYV